MQSVEKRHRKQPRSGDAQIRENDAVARVVGIPEHRDRFRRTSGINGHDAGTALRGGPVRSDSFLDF
jgi:hypothetical protein